jgi:hypothetical protein
VARNISLQSSNSAFPAFSQKTSRPCGAGDFGGMEIDGVVIISSES